MSLATRCPACGTIFRVVQDQLKVSEGWVRCGQCHEVFHGIEALFDLDSDPQEARDLAQEPGYRGLAADCETELRRVVDPDAADALAKADQRARIDAFGGREAILARGGFGHSPVPGTKPVYG